MCWFHVITIFPIFFAELNPLSPSMHKFLPQVEHSLTGIRFLYTALYKLDAWNEAFSMLRVFPRRNDQNDQDVHLEHVKEPANSNTKCMYTNINHQIYYHHEGSSLQVNFESKLSAA